MDEKEDVKTERVSISIGDVDDVVLSKAIFSQGYKEGLLEGRSEGYRRAIADGMYFLGLLALIMLGYSIALKQDA